MFEAQTNKLLVTFGSVCGLLDFRLKSVHNGHAYPHVEQTGGSGSEIPLLSLLVNSSLTLEQSVIHYLQKLGMKELASKHFYRD